MLANTGLLTWLLIVGCAVSQSGARFENSLTNMSFDIKISQKSLDVRFRIYFMLKYHIVQSTAVYIEVVYW